MLQACWTFMGRLFLIPGSPRKQRFHLLKIFKKELFQILKQDLGLFARSIMRSPVMLTQASIATERVINGALSHRYIFQKNISDLELQVHCTVLCLIF